MHRLGLVDFWYYVNEEFFFKDGHMLLRGSNGSGKSVTMQSFIPLLLDGNKSSERLDSFGTRSRKIENYLLDEDGDRDDRIGYLYLEFKREDSDVYKTIGMGLHARRNKPVDAWYFVIEDNRRINYEIQLMDHNLAITKQMLKNQIGTQLIDTQKEYMDRVNKALFNFSTRDEYKEAINLLLQLRSPKLSNSLKPTMINEILSNSLQPLSEDDLRPMSEAISYMDEIKDQLDALKQSYAAASKIAAIYEQYNLVSLNRKANDYINQERKEHSIQQELTTIKKQIAKNEEELAKTQQKKTALCQESELLNEELTSLVRKDLMQLVNDVAKYKQDLQEEKKRFEDKCLQEEEKDNQRIDARNEKVKQQDKIDKKTDEITELLETMQELNAFIQFEEHTAIMEEMAKHIEDPYDFTYSNQQIRKELEKLEDGLALFAKIDNEKQLLKNVLNEKEEVLSNIESKEKERTVYEQQYRELVEEYKEKFSKWNQGNEELSLDNAEILDIFELLQTYMEEDTYVNIDRMIQKVYLNKLKKHQHTYVTLESAVKEQQQLLLALQKELEKWQKMKDPKPVQDDYTIAARTYLKEHAIFGKPLYALLDFAPEVNEETRNIFEEQLLRMGILNAMIVNEADKQAILAMPSGHADQYLFVKENVEKLAVYTLELTKDGQIDIAAMLHYFGIENEQLAVFAHAYRNGSITGTVSREEKAVFIGEQAREAYRLEKIADLEKQLEIEKTTEAEIKATILSLKVQMEQLEKEYHAYPDKADLDCAKQEIMNCDKEMIFLRKHLQSLQNYITKYEEEIKKLGVQIAEIAGHLGITATKEVFEKRKDYFREYEQNVNSLNQCHSQLLSAYELYSRVSKDVEKLEKDLDAIRYERKIFQEHIDLLDKQIMIKEEQLQQEGYQDVKKRIDEIQMRLPHIPEEISDMDQKIGKMRENIKKGNEDFINKEQDQQLQKAEKERSYTIYLKEAQLGYIIKDENACKDVSYVLQFIKERISTTKGKDILTAELQKIFYLYRGDLQEYGLTQQNLFEDCGEGNSRLDLYARYKGIRIPFHSLLDNLQSDIDKQSILLEDSDRSLIEDILVNTISRKIRTHIQNSRHWVEIMNRYMNAMNTSSGLKLSLQWKSHKAENDEELSSEQLVKLLEKDIRILKDADLKHLSSHFRSKIAMARKLSEQQDNHNSFHQIMKSVMDYRTWFDFRILYEKTGEKKKELTNNAFYAFSGGEKAMSMYIPLFSAVAAKFEGAGDDAPLLIALDEAFAGVDEKNISNMFSLISKFNFDYIMNSQVLWGDYPSVRALAIHELFRPENAHYVTVISYEWNGHEKRMVDHL